MSMSKIDLQRPAQRRDATRKAAKMTDQEHEKMVARVTARNRTYTGFGRSASAAEWARLLDLPRNTVWKYLQKGLTPEEIATARGVSTKFLDE